MHSEGSDAMGEHHESYCDYEFPICAETGIKAVSLHTATEKLYTHLFGTPLHSASDSGEHFCCF